MKKYAVENMLEKGCHLTTIFKLINLYNNNLNISIWANEGIIAVRGILQKGCHLFNCLVE